MTITPELVFALIGTLGSGGALVALLKLRADKRKIFADAGKVNADAAAVIQGTAVALLQPLHDEIERLRTEVTSSRGQVLTLTAEVDTLRGQVRTLTDELERERARRRGGTSVPRPRRAPLDGRSS